MFENPHQMDWLMRLWAELCLSVWVAPRCVHSGSNSKCHFQHQLDRILVDILKGNCCKIRFKFICVNIAFSVPFITLVYFWSNPDRMGRWGFKTLFKLSIFLLFLVFFLNILFRNFFIQILYSQTSLIRQQHYRTHSLSKLIVYFIF